MVRLDLVYEKIEAINDRFDKGWREEDLRFLTNALAGEVGELCNSVKHLYGGGTHKVDVTYEDLLLEAADVFVYLAMVIENVRGRDVSLAEFADVVNIKMDEVRLRFAVGARGDR